LKTLVYFELVSTAALAVGLIVGELVQPGAGFNIDPRRSIPRRSPGFVSRAREE